MRNYRKPILVLTIVCFAALSVSVLAQEPQPSRLAHTYSIVARDPATGQIGTAVQSHWFSVGSIVIWAEAGVGAVATQSFVRVDYGPLGIQGLRAGSEPGALLTRLKGDDNAPQVRQVAMVDSRGRVAAHTGAGCIPNACDLQGDGFSVQANMMLNPTVCTAMKSAFEKSTGTLPRRLLAALQAAEGEGGDIRGRQSAALKVVEADRQEHPWEGIIVDLRVDDSSQPLDELERLLTVQEAYNSMNEGDLAIEHGQMEAALEHYSDAVKGLPDRLEPKFWQAVQLASVGRLPESLPIFKEVFAENPHWLELAKRLVKVDLLPKDPAVIEAIAAQGPKR